MKAILYILAVLLMVSCSMEKRRYSKGFHITHHRDFHVDNSVSGTCSSDNTFMNGSETLKTRSTEKTEKHPHTVPMNAENLSKNITITNSTIHETTEINESENSFREDSVKTVEKITSLPLKNSRSPVEIQKDIRKNKRLLLLLLLIIPLGIFGVIPSIIGLIVFFKRRKRLKKEFAEAFGEDKTIVAPEKYHEKTPEIPPAPKIPSNYINEATFFAVLMLLSMLFAALMCSLSILLVIGSVGFVSAFYAGIAFVIAYLFNMLFNHLAKKKLTGKETKQELKKLNFSRAMAKLGLVLIITTVVGSLILNEE